MLTKPNWPKCWGFHAQACTTNPKRENLDQEVKSQIEAVLIAHPAYGHKRIAWHLKLNKKRIRRVMKKYGLKPYRRSGRLVKRKDLGKAAATHPNLLPLILARGNLRAGEVWCTDFTYIKFQGRFIYLSTLVDLSTREVVGFNLARFHNRHLVIGALADALRTHAPPEVVHSDQGSEYQSADFENLVKMVGAQISMSEKGSPWQNGYQESFFGHFKKEAGDLNRFEDLGELVEDIYQQLYYYNNLRIHSVLKMPPVEFRKRQTV